jgi:hypothetical protein
MASVFLSYDRDDAAKARPLAAALEKAGHSVWWDLRVRGGAQFSKVIEEALQAADAVVVLWSKNSVDSAWVRDEAAAGRAAAAWCRSRSTEPKRRSVSGSSRRSTSASGARAAKPNWGCCSKPLEA